ncbi:hypothetical protein ABL78_0794 [Leptomonas seymouri]|uniref:Uncharacterized protein n=1 Tax=Leptomonas seymouri TaxID=5684 RepID=A0A0N0P8N4_LEPSE|nr:hypothetical protein ABL78_0794 [Leptomonas seymouri]|eukprot:KPI90149.1 hypothetical protein ABL78_0794 [Leptomonas seymouri]
MVHRFPASSPRKAKGATAPPSLTTSTSSSSTQSAMLADSETDSVDRYSSTTASPASFSPVTFMSDSNRSAPTLSPPSPPPPTAGDSADTENEAEGTAPVLVAFNDVPRLEDDTAHHGARYMDLSKAAQTHSTLSFRSSLFSYTSTSTTADSAEGPGVPGRASPSRPSPLSTPHMSDAVEGSAQRFHPSPQRRSSQKRAMPRGGNGLRSSLPPSPDPPPQRPCAFASSLVDTKATKKVTAVAQLTHRSMVGGAATMAQISPQHSATLKGEELGDKIDGDRTQLQAEREQQLTPDGAENKQEESLKRLLDGPDDLDTISTLPTSALESLTASTPPPTPQLSISYSTSLTTTDHLLGLAATLRDTYGCPSLSQLASGLLCNEALDTKGQPLVTSGRNSAALSWTPKSLPSAPAKGRRRKDLQAPAAASSKSSKKRAQAEAVATTPSPERASGNKSAKKKHKKELDGAADSKRPEGEEVKVADIALLQADDTPTPIISPSLPPPHEPAQPEAMPTPVLKENEDWTAADVAPTLSTLDAMEASAPKELPRDGGFGGLDIEKWSPSQRPFPSIGNANVSPLSQLSFLVSESAARQQQDTAPLKMKRSRKSKAPRGQPPGEANLPLDGHVAPSHDESTDTIAANAAGAQDQLLAATLVPEFLMESARDDELLIDQVWSGEQKAVENLCPTPATAPLQKRNRKGQARPNQTDLQEPFTLSNRRNSISPEGGADPLAWWRATRAAAASNIPSAGRPCLWVEVSKLYQESYATVLRQLLVYWGCIHQQKCEHAKASDKDGSSAAVATSRSFEQPSTASSSHRKRSRTGQSQSAESSPPHSSLHHGAPKGNDGIVILLCQPTVSLAEVLQWWTQRAHVAHGFMPPLLAVSMTEESVVPPPAAWKPGVSAAADFSSENSSATLLARAVLHASCDTQMDASRSLAVSCSEAGKAAFAHILSHSQIYASPSRCADVLAAVLRLPPTARLFEGATAALTEEEVDVGSLAAVMATTTCSSDAHYSPLRGETGATRRPAFIQEKCFEELCRWNGLAARLRDKPRRPQLLLHRVCTDVLPDAPMQLGEVTVKEKRKIKCSGSTHTPASQTSQPLLSLWLSYGLVRPATRNEDTFANAARREARLLAGHAPPVTLLPAHMSIITLFASLVFQRGNYTTAVNLVDAHARAPPRRLTDYISGYNCVFSGPMHYVVSATVRRYLHVRLDVNVTPLLALGSATSKSAVTAEGTKASRKRGAATAAGATRRPAATTEASVVQAVVHLARTQWRGVLGFLSCTCTPRVYERTAHTDDGTKVCRHLAELFYYFVTQQFRVLAGGQRGPSRIFGGVAGGPARRLERVLGSDVPPVPPSVKELTKPESAAKDGDLQSVSQASPDQLGASSSKGRDSGPEKGGKGTFTLEADALLANEFSLVLYSDSTGTLAGHEGSGDADAPDAESRGETLLTVASEPVPEETPAPSSGMPNTTSSRREKKAHGASAAAPQPGPAVTRAPLQPPPPPPAPAAQSFHNEALQYALQFISQHRVADDAGTPPETPHPRPPGLLPHKASTAKAAPASSARRKRSREEERPVGSVGEAARALQLVEQLLRDALHGEGGLNVQCPEKQ